MVVEIVEGTVTGAGVMLLVISEEESTVADFELEGVARSDVIPVLVAPGDVTVDVLVLITEVVVSEVFPMHRTLKKGRKSSSFYQVTI